MGRVFFNTRENVHNLTGAYTVLASDSGKVFTIDQDATFVITLPADQEGLNYKFIVTDAGSGEVHITSGASNGIKGWSMDPTTGINAIDNVLVEIAASTATVGDVVELVNDGTTWWCKSFSGATNGIVGADS
tara:strand:+ start:64 stop:459 length:396 start_codon:yes stop_codon:yes gene_type:complete